MVNKVVGMNGKPFDGRDFEDENRKAVEQIIFSMADDIDTGDIVARGAAIMVITEDKTPRFWFAGAEDDMFLLFGGIEAMRQTFWESVIKEYQYDDGE